MPPGRYRDRCSGAELDAQTSALALLLRLSRVHGPMVLESLLASKALLSLADLLHARPPPPLAVSP
jgi:hypothetical protein